jgi:ATP-binding cassette, subfamily F, member 3
MSLLIANGVGVAYGGRTIFEDVTFTVSRGDRWGVLGRNGTGKTSLFRLLTGALEPTKGSIARSGGVRVALLDQHREFGEAVTVRDGVAAAFADLIALEHSLAEQAAALADAPTQAALDRYDHDLHRFEREGGYTYGARVDAVLHGLGFDDTQASQRLDSLSGGERGRVALARQLVTPADVWLLDEPTNHLDLDTTEWLEEYLRTLDGTVMVISHDRVFLDRVVDHILHFEASTATPYAAGYAAFVEQRNERRLTQQRAYDQQSRKVAAEEDYIRRNIAGQNSRQAKGRRKRLERLPRMSPPPTEESVMALRLSAGSRGGDQVLVAEDVRLEIDDRVLLDDFAARVMRGEVVGLIGPNGSGKSTLLRAIAGERTVDGGSLETGASIRTAFYRQDLAQVPTGKTLFDVIHDLRPLWDRGQVQGHLGRFGFSGDEVLRKGATMSGGEQARLALAMIVLAGANLLLFDEPTNHLDVESIEALEDALFAYDGTVLLVSHDRALLRALTTRIWSLRDTRIEDYPGTFTEWEIEADERARRDAEAAAALDEERRAEERRRARREHTSARVERADRKAAAGALADAEARVHSLEAEVTRLEALLRDPALYVAPEGVARSVVLNAELKAARQALDEAFAEWASMADG